MGLVVAVLGVLFTIYMVIKHRSSGFIVIVPIALLVALLVGLIVDGPVNWVMREKVEFSYNLAALNDGKNTQGSFFLGSGTIDSVPSFMFYKEDNGGYVLRDWPAGSARVVESEGNPHVVYTCYDYSNVPPPFRWTSRLITDDYVDCRGAFVTFYVPSGSVKQQYNLDAQ